MLAEGFLQSRGGYTPHSPLESQMTKGPVLLAVQIGLGPCGPLLPGLG